MGRVADPDKLVTVREHALPRGLGSIIRIHVYVDVSGRNILTSCCRAISVARSIRIGAVALGIPIGVAVRLCGSGVALRDLLRRNCGRVCAGRLCRTLVAVLAEVCLTCTFFAPLIRGATG